MSALNKRLAGKLKALTEHLANALFEAVQTAAVQSRDQNDTFAAITLVMERFNSLFRSELREFRLGDEQAEEYAAEIGARALELLHSRLGKTGGNLIDLLPRGRA